MVRCVRCHQSALPNRMPCPAVPNHLCLSVPTLRASFSPHPPPVLPIPALPPPSRRHESPSNHLISPLPSPSLHLISQIPLQVSPSQITPSATPIPAPPSQRPPLKSPHHWGKKEEKKRILRIVPNPTPPIIFRCLGLPPPPLHITTCTRTPTSLLPPRLTRTRQEKTSEANEGEAKRMSPPQDGAKRRGTTSARLGGRETPRGRV